MGTTLQGQKDKASAFSQLHLDPTILVLPNAWDVASAKIYERKGFAAVGTTSAGIAASLGYPDGEYVPKHLLMETTKRITDHLAIPVTADIVNGYGSTYAEVLDTVRTIIECGVVGINIEDGLPNHTLEKIESQSEKIRAIRQLADTLDIPLVINARIDTYWSQIGEPSIRQEQTIQRANTYLRAGADSIFIPSVSDPATIQTFVSMINGPINILAGPHSPCISELEQWGVSRVSFGSGPIRRIFTHIEAIADEIASQGTYHTLTDPMPYSELNHLSE
ncbi:2-Methylisocitrate lyase, PEP mutase family [Marininema mesophilum]|uniref:2-Methylisocitrate lyase, PEP mutase family n=1 Tax=Marininema mesophilum TaxID=1048340 RepID=A0A1H3B4G6_9BACL|nr:isocitrate lyase/phosphoenolpyruvate mutase family protein [Marininema mesophilum]SDX35949.1 2-Methylisocitrate lyase, PEP mutase family [Marininema mesophilum]